MQPLTAQVPRGLHKLKYLSSLFTWWRCFYFVKF